MDHVKTTAKVREKTEEHAAQVNPEGAGMSTAISRTNQFAGE